MNKMVVEKILDFYDIPQLFVSKDKVDTRYLCLFANIDDKEIKYISTKISLDRLYQFETGKIDLKSIFENPEINEYYIIKLIESTEEAFLFEIYKESITQFLPDADFYLNTGHLDNLLRKLAIENNRNVYQLHLSETGKSNTVSANLLSDYIKNVNYLIKNSIVQVAKNVSGKYKKVVDKMKSINIEVFAFSEGSLNVYFKTNSFVDMFGRCYDDIFIDKLKELIDLDINNDAIIQKTFRENKGDIINSINALCKKIIINKTPLEIYYSSANGKDEGKIIIDETRANIYSNLIESKIELQKEEVEFIGTFMQADVERGSWRLKIIEVTNEIIEIIGKSSGKILSGVVLEKVKYLVKCEKKTIEDKITGEEKPQYLLIDYHEN